MKFSEHNCVEIDRVEYKHVSPQTYWLCVTHFGQVFRIGMNHMYARDYLGN